MSSRLPATVRRRVGRASREGGRRRTRRKKMEKEASFQPSWMRGTAGVRGRRLRCVKKPTKNPKNSWDFSFDLLLPGYFVSVCRVCRLSLQLLGRCVKKCWFWPSRPNISMKSVCSSTSPGGSGRPGRCFAADVKPAAALCIPGLNDHPSLSWLLCFTND